MINGNDPDRSCPDTSSQLQLSCRSVTLAVMQAGVGYANSNYQAYAHSNVAGLTNVLEVAKVNGVELWSSLHHDY